MNSLLLAAAVAMVVRSLAAARLDRWNLGAPVVMVLAGVAVGVLNESSIAAVLNTEAVQHAAEIILAVLLFVDATEVRGGRLWGGYPGLVARVLLVALPVSLGLAMVVGWLLYPDLPWPVLLLIAGVTVPTDFAPAERWSHARGPRRCGRIALGARICGLAVPSQPRSMPGRAGRDVVVPVVASFRRWTR